MRIGFTGTRRGMTPQQKDEVKRVLLSYLSFGTSRHVVIHGQCVGADKDFDDIVLFADPYGSLARRRVRPSNLPAQVAKLSVPPDFSYEPADPLARNHAIVDDCELLIACPGEMNEVQRSGTWATVRYARRVKKPLFIVWPHAYTAENFAVQSTQEG